MVTPSQSLIVCKGCGQHKAAHPKRRLFCVECVNKMAVAYTAKYREKQKLTPRILACKACGKDFDASLTGRTWRCPECLAAYQKEYAQKDKERHAEYSRNYRTRMGDEYREKMVNRRKEAISAMSEAELAEFRRKEADKSRRIAANLRQQVFAAYGGFKCACCGETEPLFLTIDHINNDGHEQRRNGDYRGGTAFYQWLKKNHFPAGYQVLCMNCNLGKHRNGGVCPHQGRCNDYSVMEVEPSGSKRIAPSQGDEIVCSAEETCSSS